MYRPRIGITTDTHDKPDHYESPTAYATAVEKAGYGVRTEEVPHRPTRLGIR